MSAQLAVPDPEKARLYFENKVKFSTGPIEVDHMLTETQSINLVDVRREEDYAKGHVPGAVNLPEDRWATLEGLSKEKVNVLYCYTQTCHLAAKAAVIFAANGYPVMEMDGGFDAWKKAGLKVDKVPMTERLRRVA